MATADPWTVGRLLAWTTDYLKGRNSESPRLDAEVLLAHALGCKRIELYTTFEDIPPEDKRTVFRELVKRRAEGSPVAYLVGQREFFSMQFQVSPAVLIPRPETELIVVKVLDLAKGRKSEPLFIADIGTGSGILAVVLAKQLPAAKVTAIDISPESLKIAASNAEKHGVAQRIDFVESDLFDKIPPEVQFDFIVSNPPYVSEAEYALLPRGVKDFEPRTALLAGPTGTELIARLIPQAAQRLKPGGHLFMEVSPMIAEAARELSAANACFEPGSIVKDLARVSRVVQAKRRPD
jgi:release factor glutamine methyltransferase